MVFIIMAVGYYVLSVFGPAAQAGFGIGTRLLGLIQMPALAIALVMAALLAILLSRTRVGLAIQAVGSDRDAAQLVGIDLRHAYAVTFGLGAAVAGVAGGMIAMIQAITPTAGEPYTLQAFVVVILGGLGRVSATVVGGLVFGLVEGRPAGAFHRIVPGQNFMLPDSDQQSPIGNLHMGIYDVKDGRPNPKGGAGYPDTDLPRGRGPRVYILVSDDDNQDRILDAAAERGATILWRNHFWAEFNGFCGAFVDPWGTVVAERASGDGVVVTTIDGATVAKRRTQMPCLSHAVLWK